MTDAADVDDVPLLRLEFQFASLLHVFMSDPAVRLERPIFGDMRMPDKHDARVGGVERTRGGALVENIFEVVDGRAVHEQKLGQAHLVRKPVQPFPARLVEHALRPDDRGPRGIVEVFDAEVLGGSEIVIAQDGVAGSARAAQRRTRSDSVHIRQRRRARVASSSSEIVEKTRSSESKFPCTSETIAYRGFAI